MIEKYKIKIINIFQRVYKVEKGRLIVGALLILLGITLNEFLITRILSEDGSINFENKLIIWLFDIITICLGIKLLFNVTFSIDKFLSILQNYHLRVLFIQFIAFTMYLWFRGSLLYHTGYGDEPSYILFSFSSLKEILDQHRTFGLPLILQCYSIVFPDYELWPTFQLIIFLASILYIYSACLKFKMDKIMSIVFSSALLWNGTWLAFRYINSEPIGAAALNFTIGAMFIAFHNQSIKTFVVLLICTFFTYQIRPAFSFLAALIPVWAIIMILIKYNYNFYKLRRAVLFFSSATLLPLLLFCLLRLIMVEQFGVVSLMGADLAGHATHYLNEDNIKKLSGENRILADEILTRKRSMTYPSNIAPFSGQPIPNQSKYVTEWKTWNYMLMTAWLVAIKQKMGVEPFEDPSKNIEAWNHTDPNKYVYGKNKKAGNEGTLSGFFSISNTEIDIMLMDYAKSILEIEWKQYYKWIIFGSYEGIKNYIKNQYNNSAILLIFFSIFWVQISIKTLSINKELLTNWNKDLCILLIIGFTIFIIGFIPTILVAVPNIRYLTANSQFIYPTLLLAVIIPFWLK